MTDNDIGPWTPSVELVESVLHGSGILAPDAHVEKVGCADVAESGLVGWIRRVHVEYSHDVGQAPRSLILKSPTGHVRGGSQMALAELEFYRRGLAAEASLSVPTVHAFGPGDELLMDDLGQDGFVAQSIGYSPAMALRVVDEIAKLHTCFSGRPLSDEADWIRPPLRSQVAEFCRHHLQSWEHGWPEVLGPLPELLTKHFDEVATALDSPDRTLAHGDFHSQNIHLSGDDCTVIDFQFVQHASGMLDIARLLATSLTTDVRRGIEHHLLDTYHAKAGGRGRHGASSGLDELRAGLLWNFCTPLALHLTSMKARGTGWPSRLPILERCLIAAQDWGALTLLR